MHACRSTLEDPTVVAGDVREVYITASGIESLDLGGSLIGGSLENAGLISAGFMDSVKVRGNVIGGAGSYSGYINTAGAMGPVEIGGSLLGGGADSGTIYSATSLATVSIGGDVQGGAGDRSGRIASSGSIGSVLIHGSLIGGSAIQSGTVSSGLSIPGSTGSVTVDGNIIGGTGDSSGQIYSSGFVNGVTVGGSVRGGVGVDSGGIRGDDGLGRIVIEGDLAGGSGSSSGRILTTGALASVEIGRSVLGAVGNFSGQIFSIGNMGAVTIGGDLVSGSGADSGSIISPTASIGDVNVGGSFVLGDIHGGGGLGDVSIGGDVVAARVVSVAALGDVSIGGLVLNGLISAEGDMGDVTIGGDLIGTIQDFCRIVSESGLIPSVEIGGSVVGGAIVTGGDIGAITIFGDLRGNSIGENAPDLYRSGYIQGARIESVQIGGSIIAGIDASNSGNHFQNASIRADNDIGSIHVEGSIFGRDDFGFGASPVIISARGEATPVGADSAIGSLTVEGRVERARILGGFDVAGASQNANAEIGPVRVSRDWIASDLIGNGRLASVTIDGVIIGSDDTADGFVFQSREIAAFTSTGNALALTAGAMNDTPVKFSANSANDVTLFETGAPSGPPAPVFAANLQIVNSTTATYTDIDGDKVTLTVSKGTLTAGLFTFSPAAASQQLRVLDLSGGGFAKANVTFSVQQIGSGDGFANVGFIDSTDHDLGRVTVAGDLGQIDAGDATLASPALKALSVRSLGRFGLATQGGVGDLQSNLDGALGSLTVAEDIKEASVLASGATSDDPLGSIGAVSVGGSFIGGGGGAFLSATGKLGPVRIGGDILGGAGTSSAVLSADEIASLNVGGSMLGGTGSNSASATTHHNSGIGDVRIGRDLAGGPGVSSAVIESVTGIDSVTLGGSLLGGSENSARIASAEKIGAVTIDGSVVGGAEALSGRIRGEGGVRSVFIANSLIGGTGERSGTVESEGNMGAVRVGGSIIGGAGEGSGSAILDATTGQLASVTVDGSVIGGSGPSSAFIGSRPIGIIGTPSAADVGPVKIGGGIFGGSGPGSGTVQGAEISSIRVAGSLQGSANSSGVIDAVGKIGALFIGGDVAGGASNSSGVISGGFQLAEVTVRGSLVGGAGLESGTILASAFLLADGKLGAISIGGDVIGGSGSSAGLIYTDGVIDDLAIGGSVIGGSAANTGTIFAGETIGRLTIGRDLRGGSLGDGDAPLDRTGYIEADRLKTISVGGSLIAGRNDSNGAGSLSQNASIRVAHDLGKLKVAGDVVGQAGNAIVISAVGKENLGANATRDLAIKSITIGGGIARTEILAGFATDESRTGGSNGNASIGKVKVGEDFLTTSISAGVQDNGSAGFGDMDDTVINFPPGAPTDDVIARIAKIKVGGVVGGIPHPLPSVFYGITAEQIGSFKSLGFKAPLTGGPSNDVVQLSPTTQDVTLREV